NPAGPGCAGAAPGTAGQPDRGGRAGRLPRRAARLGGPPAAPARPAPLRLTARAGRERMTFGLLHPPSGEGAGDRPVGQLDAVAAAGRTRRFSRSGSSQAEVAGDGVLDFGELVAVEVVGRVADEVVGVDASDLVDEEPGLLAVDLQGRPEDGRLSGGRGGNDRGHAPRHRTWAQHESEAPAALFVPARGRAEIHAVDRAADHHPSASPLTSSAASRSASERAWASHTSRSSSRSARRITSLVRSSGRMAALMIRSSSSVGRNPIVFATAATLPPCSTTVTQM